MAIHWVVSFLWNEVSHVLRMVSTFFCVCLVSFPRMHPWGLVKASVPLLHSGFLYHCSLLGFCYVLFVYVCVCMFGCLFSQLIQSSHFLCLLVLFSLSLGYRIHEYWYGVSSILTISQNRCTKTSEWMIKQLELIGNIRARWLIGHSSSGN